jgi:ribosomal protein L40E
MSLFDDHGTPDSGGEPATPVDTPTRVCRKCSANATTAAMHCPYCGASYLRGWKGKSRRAKVALLVLPLVIVLGGGGTATALKLQHDQQLEENRTRAAQAAEDAAERKREAEARRAEAAEDARQQQIALDRIERSERRLIEKSMRNAMRDDANEEIADGWLEGPMVTHVRCDPVAGGSDSLDEPTARYDCLAVNEVDYDDGTERGYSYEGTVNFNKGSYTWKLGG